MSYHWITGHHGRLILGEAKALRALLDRLQQVGAQFVVGLQIARLDMDQRREA